MILIFLLRLHFWLSASPSRGGQSAKLPITSERLGAAAASTTVHAGYKRSFSHCLFCGRTAAVAPNRQLAAGIFTH